jgi:hypothetical protein
MLSNLNSGNRRDAFSQQPSSQGIDFTKVISVFIAGATEFEEELQNLEQSSNNLQQSSYNLQHSKQNKKMIYHNALKD